VKPSLLKLVTILKENGGILQRQQLQKLSNFKPNAFRARLSELRKLGMVSVEDNNVILLRDTIDENEKQDTENLTKKLQALLDEGIIIEKEREVEGRKATVVISDMHFGDENVMLNTYRSAVNNLIKKLRELDKEKKISLIRIILNGDIVSGRGIFRWQEAQNVFNKGNIQILYASAFILELHEKLSEIAETEYFVLKGNHDQHRKDNYAWELTDKLRSYGLNAFYAGHQLIMNLGNDNKQHWVLIEHGYGGSDYYPVSYDFLRNTWKKITWLNRLQKEKRRDEIERVIVGHSHWLVTNLRQDPFWAIDVSGGFQRNERVELGKNQRPAGFLLYVFDEEKDGLTIYDWKKGLRLFEIVADEEIMLHELLDPALELKNRMDAPKTLMQLYNKLVEMGLIKKEVG